MTTDEAALLVLARFGEVAKRLASTDGHTQAVQDLWRRVVVEILNAGGVPMSGATISDTAPSSPSAVFTLAEVMGVRATPHRSQYSIYPHAKPSAGASAAIVYIEEPTREPAILLVRRVKDSGQWSYPAGYMELLPEADRVVAERVSSAAGHALEEHTEGAMRAAQGSISPTAPSGPSLRMSLLPSGREIREALDREFRKLLSTEGWESANAKMNDAGHMRAALLRSGIALPSGIDVTIEENLYREVQEETGLNLSDFPGARPSFVRMNLSLAYSSGGQRNYTANPHFLVDLETSSNPPRLGKQSSEIAEAAWIYVRNIVTLSPGHHAVDRGDGTTPLPFNAYAVPVVQESIHAWLSKRIAHASGFQFGSVRNIYECLRRRKAESDPLDQDMRSSAERILSEKPSDSGMLPELTGPTGVRRFTDYLMVTRFLSQGAIDRPA